MKKARLLLVAAAFGLGCSIFQGEEDPQVSQGQAPVLTVNQLDNLKLETVGQVFPPDASVTVESLGHRAGIHDTTQGGRYAFTPKAGITVRVYGGEHGGKAGLTALMEDSAALYQLVEPTEAFPLAWWYQEGPPATVLFAYGNTLTTMQLGILEPAVIRKRCAAAVRAMALRILRCSRGQTR